MESGRDTILKGGRIEGEKVQADAGGSLTVESEQDRKTYRENGKNTGISLGYDISSGKVSGLASAGKSHTDSHYESVTNQAGIYAGDKGFDITVKAKTHLKGAVIDSKGDAERNTFRTGTLSWEDVENKADYRLSGKGIAVNKKPNAPYNEKGITPAIPTGSSDKADSTTRAGIAPGTIMIQDKDNQRQDMTALNRNTRDSLNKLGEIFDQTKVEERQELAGLFGKLAFNYLHDAKLTPNQRAAWHAAIGGIMGQLSNRDFIAGALPAGINEMMIGEIQKAAHGDPALMQWIGACVGAVAGQLVSGQAQLGGSASASGVKNNDSLEAEQAASHGDSASQVIEADEMNTSSQYNDFNNEEELSDNQLSLKIIKIGINSGMIPDPKTMKTDYCLGKIEGGVFKLAGAEAGYILDKMGNVYKFIGTSVSAGVGAPVSVGIGTGNIYGDRNDIIGSISGVSIGFGGSGVVGVSVSRGVAEESPITVELITDASAGTNISWRYTEYVGNIYS
ncbi:MAG TPA: hemagglutinin repeat-containing protein [Veillonellaceae bacterium]|nr:hemagglutinin repeat-containing protein [Veillonellaceae bacterium]